MATVYRARDTVLERDVALKVLHPHLRGAPEARARFAREARAVAKLRHPNVLDVYDFGDDEASEAYLAAELLTGPTLKEWIASQPRLAPELAVALAVLIAQALAAAHDADIVHRDVKPENVLLHEKRTLKLTDFGIAHLVDAHTFTATGQVIGSPGHMAPEIVQGGDACVATDVFAFGTVLYFLLTGTLPFTGRNPHQLLFRVLEVDYVDPLRIEPAIGAELRSLVVRTLAKDPAERPVSMAAIVAELTAFLAARGFDDPVALAREALSDPAAATARVRPLALAAELALGDACVKQRDSMGALAHYDRALAIEPGRADVLDRVRAIGKEEAVPKRLQKIALGLGLFGIAALGLAFFGMQRLHPTATTAATIRADRAPVRARPQVPLAATARPSVALPSMAAAPAERTVEARPEHSAAETRPRTGAPRMVVFRPEPQNVTIAIDGAAPRTFGPSFRGQELAIGAHRVRIASGTECCEAIAFEIDVTPGATPLVVSRTLPLRSARLYLVSSVPADVVVSIGGATVARGRARELLPIPMGSLEGTAQYVVTAEGYHGYTGQVRLRAGEVARATVALEAATP